MKYAYVYDGLKHELKEFDNDVEHIENQYISFICLSEEEYNRFIEADTSKYHHEWDDEHKTVLAEYGAQEWVEIKDGMIVSSAGYRFSETCVKAERKIVYGYDGGLYYEDDLPEKPRELKEKEIRAVRNQYLADTDKYMIADFPISEEKRGQYSAYRQYLRDYTKQENWWENPPETFEK